MKLLALAISLGLWFAVTAQRAPAAIRLRSVPLSFLLPEDLEISNDPREQVEVTLGGEQHKLNKLVASNLVVTADLRNYRAGERVARLTPENVSMDLEEGVRIIKIEPAGVPLKLEPRVERDIEVAAQFGGEPAPGFTARAEINPPRVRVRGAASHVEKLQNAPTETISLDGRRESFMLQQVAVDITDEKVVALDSVVAVKIVIEEPTIERRIENIEARVGEASGGRRVALVLRGARSLIENLRADELRVVWEPATGDVVRGEVVLVPRVVLPVGMAGRVEVMSVEPARFVARTNERDD